MTTPGADRRIESIIRAVQESDVRRFHLVSPDFEVYISRDDDTGTPWANGVPSAQAPTTSSLPSEPAQGTHIDPAAAPTPVATAAPAAAAAVAVPPAGAGEKLVLSPMIGVFYIAPEPGAAPFVTPGDVVEPTATVGLVEAMKLFTAVEAGVAGTVVEVLVANGDYVEFEQPLMRIQTSQQGA
jgi:acetyl-CoA carboxylase biotin carboxyl carrier protein